MCRKVAIGPKVAKNIIPLSQHLPEIQIEICVENLISNIYLVAFNHHGPCTVAVNESTSHS